MLECLIRDASNQAGLHLDEVFSEQVESLLS